MQRAVAIFYLPRGNDSESKKLPPPLLIGGTNDKSAHVPAVLVAYLGHDGDKAVFHGVRFTSPQAPSAQAVRAPRASVC